MKMNEILAGVDFLRRTGRDADISGVEYDSRRIGPGSLFVAMQGGTTDGNRYAAAAIHSGAAAVVTDSEATYREIENSNAELVLVAHGRRALAQVSANFFEHPEETLALSGVTGTNGKTTTAFLLDAMLNHAARKTVLIGTIEYHVAGAVRSSPHTTPESRDLLALFREGVDAGATEAVMEVSSHALAQARVYGLAYDVAIFTNLTRDHLDFHGTMEDYFAAKKKLFDGSELRAPRVAVINGDAAYGAQLAEAARKVGAEVFLYGISEGDYRADRIRMNAAGMEFAMVTPQGRVDIATRLTGRVNIYNLLAASAAAMARGLSLEAVRDGIASLACVPGRFQSVDAGQDFTVVVDYAHTDDALRNLIALAREFVTATGGKVITLFGCGGDRDRTKRPLMGQAAAEGSDFVVVTSDNPRSEDPEAILRDILPGIKDGKAEFVTELDRKAAIRLALERAKPGDIVLLAGKGHEKTQTLREGTISFDDAEVAVDALRNLKGARA
ncbi:UDP-N-acetylmuramoyl-L-alanyl-D-glutamate--2,6-diaminopimelate ligase [Silvibacterium acidisoli]|uniref:UDP-N-acetylmuramoyl-L-alanyl-D-glutamate--2, 6-diaminopimelate ligase n=1 Tax=Acidobacteriaceae bacterium ZG23-2 TaxID=2883246 RepID=UPI00406C8DCB